MKPESQTDKERDFWLGYNACKAPEPDAIPLKYYKHFIMGSPYPVKKLVDEVA